MKILLDTHIFLWALSDPERLTASEHRHLLDERHQLYISSITIAEIQIKVSIGKLHFPSNPVEMITLSGFNPLDFTGDDALALSKLPFHHRDPFDRMLVSQAINRDLPILTRDKRIGQYDCRIVG